MPAEAHGLPASRLPPHQVYVATSNFTDYLLRLPNELLDIIALFLCGDKATLDLSCVNKRLCHVAQGAMMRRLCVPNENGVRRVLEMLATSDAASQVCHLDLIKYIFSGHCGDRQLIEHDRDSGFS